ncbi:MAG TPA: hypothetical protein VF576_06045, partial [Rubricoccaceae bacterium]
SPVPGAWTEWEGETFKVLRTRIDAGAGRVGAPGETVEAGPRLIVACGEGAVEVLEAQREGKRRMSAADLLRGSAPAVGDRLGGPAAATPDR